jgi:hypothetical protein
MIGILSRVRGISRDIRWREIMADKWTFRQSVKLQGDDNLGKLLKFYLWETPVPDTSCKGRTFSQYGWNGKLYRELHARMREVSGFPIAEDGHWVKARVSDIEKELAILNRLDHYDCSFEFAVHAVKNDLNDTQSLFYLIRNSFAHGGFRICHYNGERYFVFENREKGRLKGRAIFKEHTLLSWIGIVKRGPGNDNRH